MSKKIEYKIEIYKKHMNTERIQLLKEINDFSEEELQKFIDDKIFMRMVGISKIKCYMEEFKLFCPKMYEILLVMKPRDL